jgi:hypothetical protein
LAGWSASRRAGRCVLPAPEADRTSLEGSLRNLGGRPPLFTSLASLERERPKPEVKAIEVATASLSALGLRRAEGAAAGGAPRERVDAAGADSGRVVRNAVTKFAVDRWQWAEARSTANCPLSTAP